MPSVKNKADRVVAKGHNVTLVKKLNIEKDERNIATGAHKDVEQPTYSCN